MTSLVQAKMINSSGVYVVGRLDSTSVKEERLSLDHVVRLTVPPKESGADNAQDVVYSLDEIKDLQSKLMLIAGKAEKGNDEVDTFVRVRKMSYFKKCGFTRRPKFRLHTRSVEDRIKCYLKTFPLVLGGKIISP